MVYTDRLQLEELLFLYPDYLFIFIVEEVTKKNKEVSRYENKELQQEGSLEIMQALQKLDDGASC